MTTDIPFKNFQTPEARKRYSTTQAHVVTPIVNSKKKVIMLSAPTGFGKSLAAVMAGHQIAPIINYVCSDKALQHQLVESFPEAVVLQGRNNYTCNLFPHLQADSCVGKCEKYKEFEIPCDYYDQKAKLLRANFRILNIHYLLFEMNYAGQLSNQELIIIDEADTLENIFIGFVGLGVTDAQIKKYGLGKPKVTVVESWIQWSQEAIEILKASYDPEYFENGLDQEYVKATKLIKKLQLFLELVQDDWIYNNDSSKSEFKPVWLTPELTEKYLFSHAKRFILMSATLPPKAVFCETLGIKIADADYIEVDSPFKIENRLIKELSIMNMKYDNRDKYYIAIDEVERIVNSHPDWKGLIHSQSYAFNEQIMESLGRNERYISHESGKDKQEQLEVYMNSSDPMVFVSPSCIRGLSLDGDLCRFNICTKMPFGSLKDKMIAARLYGSGSRGQRWYNSQCAQGVLQLSGRPVRNYTDWAITYILDSRFEWIKPLLPEWYRQAIVVGDNDW